MNDNESDVAEARFGNGLSQTPAIAGYSVGIIVAEDPMILLTGNIANASTFPFPVLYEVLEGISGYDVMAGSSEVQPKILSACKRLETRGVRAIFGACGSFANYQRAAAECVKVPTYLSVMLQVPLILAGLGGQQKLGIIAASAKAITDTVLEQCGIADRARLVIDEAWAIEEFQKMAKGAKDFRPSHLEADLIKLTQKLIAENKEIAALVLQCSDLPPFASSIQDAVKLPVYDMSTLIRWGWHAVSRTPIDLR